jgi:serine/threonine protein kinase
LPHTAGEFELSDISHRENHPLANIFIEKLISMGFSERIANRALAASDGDEVAAMTMLFDCPEALHLDSDEEEQHLTGSIAGVGSIVAAKRKLPSVFLPPSGLEIISHVDLSFNALTQPKRGSFGTVHECIWRGARVAVKQPNVISLTPRDQMRFERELKTAAKIRGPNVVQLYAACLEVGHLALVMEWVDESLNERLRRSEPLSKEKRIRIAVDIASALKYLHSENIIHRDIKGHNVMIDSNGVAKLSDFGMSTLADHQASLSAEYSVKDAFTLAFAAPELIESGGRSFSACTDVYAFGVLMWELMGNGEAPYPGVPGPFIPDLVRRGERPIVQAAAATEFGPTYVKLMAECWCSDASARPSISQIYSVLSGIGAATANPWGQMQVTPPDFTPFTNSLRECCCIGFNGNVPDDMLDAMVAAVEAFVSQNANIRQLISQVGLTELEAQCIAMYTYSNHPGASYSQKLYAEYNRAFYLRDAEAVERWYNFSHFFLSGLAKIPGQECVVYRGLDKPLTHISSHYIPGAHVCWNSLSSTTTDREGTMRSFGNAASGSIAGTFVEIRALNAKNINVLSLVPSEKELVLLPNSVFRVISAVSFTRVQQLQGLAALPSGVDLIVLQQLY